MLDKDHVFVVIIIIIVSDMSKLMTGYYIIIVINDLFLDNYLGHLGVIMRCCWGKRDNVYFFNPLISAKAFCVFVHQLGTALM